MNGEPKKSNKRLSEKSKILSGLDRLYKKIYAMIIGGFFGSLFTSYNPDSSRITKKISGKNSFISKSVKNIRQRFARNIEESVFYGFYVNTLRYLASVRLRVYGTILLTFFAYAAGITFFDGQINGKDLSQYDLTCFFLALASIPLLFSGKTLYGALGSSAVGKRILAVTGNRESGYETYAPKGRCNYAFLIGTAFGILTLFLPVSVIGKVLYRLLWAVLVFHSPEFGLVSLCFLMPFDSTMMLVLEVGVTFISYLMKLVLGKRSFKFETVDIAAFLFAVMIGVGGVFSVSSFSLKPMLVYLCFILAYFLIRNLLKSEEWLKRCVIAAVCAGSLVAAYGAAQYLTGTIGFSTQWLDETMFEGISGRAVSTLENPNVLGEYLVLIIPMAAALLFCRYSDPKRLMASFAAFSVMCACLVFTWSRGAWLGIVFAAVLFLLIWSKKTLHLFWVALLSLPHLPFILPENILSRILSIGNLADTSTAYRFNIWLGSFKMLPDRILSGIGIGSGAWSQVFPDYALPGTEVALHSHCLYLQIWIELGAMALIIFLAFIVLVAMSNFTAFKMLADTSDSMISRIYTAPLKGGDRALGRRASSRGEDVRVDRLRTTARMSAAAPLCGVLGVMVQGFTDNVWYNYRLFLMFWICIGISAAYASLHRERAYSGYLVLRREGASRSVTDVGLSSEAARADKKAPKKVKGKDGVRNAKA